MQFHSVVSNSHFYIPPGIPISLLTQTIDVSLDNDTFTTFPLTLVGDSADSNEFPVGLLYVRFAWTNPDTSTGTQTVLVLNDEQLGCDASKCRERVLDYYGVVMALQCTDCNANAGIEAYNYLKEQLAASNYSSVNVSGCGCS